MATLVNRATSDMLSGPDWAMNLELCDLINGDPRLAKDAVKALKKRMGNKNPKVQMLALTVLETMVKNCGDVIHHQIATRDILRDMVKIAKKNKDSQVSEKSLVLLDSWQEAFGGPNGRYPQYYSAYEELRRAGVMIRRRTDAVNPILTPPQTHPISADYTSPQRSPRHTTSRADASRSSDVTGMSLSDMHNARSGMEVLVEMLNAIDPKNRQALRDEVIVELVEQCRTAERRVMQLVNSTSNEELLRQALTLNDDLKKVLAKHDAIQSGAPLPKELSAAASLPATAPSLRAGNRSQKDSDDVLSQLTHRPAKPASAPASSSAQLALPPPIIEHPNNVAQPATPPAATFDLLSGDTFQSTTDSPLSAPQKAPDSLALITLDGPSSNVASSSGFQTGASNAFNITGQHTYSQQNGTPTTQYNGSPGQMNTINSYVVPWARAPSNSFETSVNPNVSSLSTEQASIHHNGSVLSPQQAALIYGGTPASGSSLTPQQNALIYGTNQMSPSTSGQQANFIYGADQAFSYGSPQFPNVSQQPGFPFVTQVSSMMPQPSSSQVYQPSAQPTSPQGYQSSFQPASPQGYQPLFQPTSPQGYQPSFQSNSPQGYQSSFQPSSSQGYLSSVQFQPTYMPTQLHQEQSFGLGAYGSYTVPSAQNQQGLATLSTNHALPPAPWSMENTSPQNPNIYANSSAFPSTSQHQQQLYQAASQFQHTSLSGHMQNLSLQGHGTSYYPEMQSTPTYTTESDYTSRKQGTPKKEVKDNSLFKDLFDIAKVKK